MTNFLLTVYGIFWPFILYHSQLSKGHVPGMPSGLDCDVTVQKNIMAFKDLYCYVIKYSKTTS